MVPFPDDVLALMNRTRELVELSTGSLGGPMVAEVVASKQQSHRRVACPNAAKTNEMGSGEVGKTENGVKPLLSTSSSPRKRMRWFADHDQETRQVYGRAIMSQGVLLLLSSPRTAQIKRPCPDRDCDPKLFENASPVNYGA